MADEVNARSLAARLLTRIERDKAFANILLRQDLPVLTKGRDRQLCTALVNGVLKHRLTLDYALRRHLRKPVGVLPVEVRQILRMGAFQILWMDRLPVSAVVDESVKLVRVVGNSSERYTGLTNAVLRRVAQTMWDFEWPDEKKDAVYALSTRYSHPQWLVKRWIDRWGAVRTEELCGANNSEAALCVRANTLKGNREDLRVRLEEEGCRGVTLSRWAPDGLCIEDLAGPVERLPSYEQGYFVVQDESSQLAGWLTGAEPGERVLDVCSAPGGKTGSIAQRMGDCGEIVAVDASTKKLELVRQMCQRLGISSVETRLGNGCVLFGLPGLFDRVMVDVPCSGLGVLRRRADLRWRISPEGVADRPPLQLAILSRAADFVKPGGVLMYTTCSVEPEENFEVVKAFRGNRPDFVPDDISEDLAFGREMTGPEDWKQWKKGMWQILPHVHGMDGFFISRMRREP
ncbi:MAG: 16S rRNA (cytosine(967)-C(5))-methyltransferase RsmB [Peptococcaceae bacterium]|nr:16S rRNA (cytosine(967)-C(5))-methyltransferase RsmB [Peptococcaceae bacterium]